MNATSKQVCKPGKYSLGLDIGTSSVGWAVLDLEKKRIHDLGVRIFERPENPQNGDSLAKPRRDARSARRRLKRRRQRLNCLKRFFIEQDILSESRVKEVLDYKSSFNRLDVYALRSEALTRELSPEELFKVLYQIAKRRGFKSNRKVVEESDKEGGRVTEALKENERFLAEHSDYKTVGDALNNDEEFAEHKRNKRDSYDNSFARDDFLHELEVIIKIQQKHALKGVDQDAIDELVYGGKRDSNGSVPITTNVNAIMYQRPFMTKELIEKMVGMCTFEKGKKRAPKASYSFEVFRLASDLVHLVFVPRDASRYHSKDLEERLDPDQVKAIIKEAKQQKTLTYKKVRSIAGISEDYVPKYVRGKKKDGDEFGESNICGGLKAYHDIRSALKDYPEDWANICDESGINKIAYILTTQKSDEGIHGELKQLPLSDEAKEAITKIKPTNFKTFGHLSIEALQKITQRLLEDKDEHGKCITYDKACGAVGYDFKKQSTNLEQITNPVVKRAVAQTLKVVRAIERKYGKPYFIKVETARDLAKSFKDRKAIERENKENQGYNEDIQLIVTEWRKGRDKVSPKTERGKQLCKDLEKLNAGIKKDPKKEDVDINGQQILKVKLYHEQNGVCPYSMKGIDFEMMLQDDNAYQIDHIVPFSRSNNDGMTNKVLVAAAENQQKGARTPYEYFGENKERWKEFTNWVEATYKTRDPKSNEDKCIDYTYNGYAMKKKQNLLLQEYKHDSWSEHALNDTRYITRFVKNYLQQTVDFAEGEDVQRVFAPNGTMTAYLRKRWGLSKDRTEDVLHHAKDAAVVAAIDAKMIYWANFFARRHELLPQSLGGAKTDKEKQRIMAETIDIETGEIVDKAFFSKEQQEFAKKEYFKQQDSNRLRDRFPRPWLDFDKEIRERTASNISVAASQGSLRKLKSYSEDEEFCSSLKPIFVSRMPRRKVRAQAHKETLRSKRAKEVNGKCQRTVRVPLNKVKLKDLENSVLKESDKCLYEKLCERLEMYGDDPEKAFTEHIYKNDKKDTTSKESGKKICLSPVSAIKVYSTQPSGFFINGGKVFVNNGLMVRLDVYQKEVKKGKIEHFFVPVYAHQVGKNKPAPTKILPAPGGFTDVDRTFVKVCSLYPNDYVRMRLKDNEMREGYYVKWNISSGVMSLISHDAPGKNNLQTVSPRYAVQIKRYDISVLGDNYEWLQCPGVS